MASATARSGRACWYSSAAVGEAWPIDFMRILVSTPPQAAKVPAVCLKAWNLEPRQTSLSHGREPIATTEVVA